jgi:ankyrin repeat protein
MLIGIPPATLDSAYANARDNYHLISLHLAADSGNPEVLRSLIERGADPDAQNKDQETPLFLASRKGRLEAARLLSELVTDINHQDLLGHTPLHVAAENGHYDIARLLLDCGADVNAREKNFRTPLHLAVELAVTRVLLERGAEVDARDEMDWTPLHFASQQGHLELMRLLLRHGADVFARDNEDQTVLHKASEHGDPDVVRWLIDRKVDPSAEDEDKETPLFPASRNGKLEATQLLLDAGANVNHRDRQDMTPLHGASENGHDTVTQLLLDRNAAVNASHVYDWTPLHLASRTGKGGVVEVLLNGGAMVNAKNDSAWTPLHMASQKGHLNVVELLLARNADLNAQEADGETALHMAAFYGHLGVAQILLKNNADPRFKNKDGETALDLALRKHHHDIEQLLKQTALVREWGGEQAAEYHLEKHHSLGTPSSGYLSISKGVPPADPPSPNRVKTRPPTGNMGLFVPITDIEPPNQVKRTSVGMTSSFSPPGLFGIPPVTQEPSILPSTVFLRTVDRQADTQDPMRRAGDSPSSRLRRLEPLQEVPLNPDIPAAPLSVAFQEPANRGGLIQTRLPTVFNPFASSSLLLDSQHQLSVDSRSISSQTTSSTSESTRSKRPLSLFGRKRSQTTPDTSPSVISDPLPPDTPRSGDFPLLQGPPSAKPSPNESKTISTRKTSKMVASQPSLLTTSNIILPQRPKWELVTPLVLGLMEKAATDSECLLRPATDGAVLAGNLEGFVSQIISDITDSSSSDRFRATFLTIYQLFATSERLFNILKRRFETSELNPVTERSRYS